MTTTSPQAVVSIIIPTYNRRELVCEAVDSVLAQSFGDFELIIVDDGSIDGTGEAIRSKSDARIDYVEIRHSGCPGLVRNRGVDRAIAPLIAFLDSDDLWEPDKLAVQINSLNSLRRSGSVQAEGNSDDAAGSDASGKDTPRHAPPPARPHIPRLIHTRERWIRNGKEISQKSQRHRRSGWIFDDSLRKCVIGPSTVIMERWLFEEIGGFREDIQIAEDYELWLRITAREPVAYIDRPLTTKRAGHGDQLSEKYGRIELFRLRALRDLIDSGYFEKHARVANAERTACQELIRKCRIYAAGARKRGRTAESEEYLDLAATYERKTQDGGANR